MLTSLDDIKRHLHPGFTEQQTDLLATCIYESYEPLVTKREMNEIRSTLKEIVVIQNRTDVRLGEIAVVQERTDKRIEQLTEAQQRTEVRIEQLTEAQQRTEVRIEQLTEAQQRTDVRIERLTASHEEIRDEIKDLVRVTKDLVWGQNDLRKQVGGIALSVGQGLEAYAMERIPGLLEERFGFTTRSVMPEILGPPGREAEIDLVYRGSREQRPVVVLCEVKTNITQKEARDFFSLADRLRDDIGVEDVRVLFFGYRAGEDARRLIAEYGGILAFPRGLSIP